MEFLHGDRAVLTDVRESDIDRIVEVCSGREFEHFMTTPWPYERQHAEGYVREFVPGGWRGDHDERVWAIRASEDGPLMGVIGLRRTNSDLGYWLHRDARGKGLMTDAVRLVVDYAFARGLDHVVWEAYPGNLASAEVARRTGFSFLGTRVSPLPDRDGNAREVWFAMRWPGEPPADAPAALDWPNPDDHLKA